MISDIHRKTAKFICDNYDTVIIPAFKSQRMVERKDSEGEWKRKIGKGTSRRLMRWGHYKFRELLRAKGEQTKTRVVVGTEEWTSKTCGKCFKIKHDLGSSKVFQCDNCGFIADRDLNAARNIMMLNWRRAGLTGRKKLRLVMGDVDT